MPTYESELAAESKFTGNVVIRFGGKYYAIREPDSGLTIPRAQQRILSSLVINPTTLDPKRVSTTIGSYSFTMLDKAGIISKVVKDTGVGVIGQDLEMWLGRSGVSMAFSDYYQMPVTRISNWSKVDNGYSFSTKEATNRMNKPIFGLKVRLSGDILAATSIIISKDDISDFPATGYFMLEGELISYASKNDGTKTFSGCARGEFNTTAEAHEDNTTLQLAQPVTANPIDILLQILTSGSGTGSYDLLDDGLGIGVQLIDVTAIEALRDSLYAGEEDFGLILSDVTDALDFIEKQILEPCQLRFTYSRLSKLTVVRLNSAGFIEEVDVLSHDSILPNVKMAGSDSKITNIITVSWDYNYSTGKYASLQTFQDDASIAAYGKAPISFQFKGITDADFVERFAAELLDRLSTPKPEIEVTAFISKRLLNIGDKSRLETTKLANELGELNFAADMEIVSRAINEKNGEVKFKLLYTGYTNTRLGYIAPSDSFTAVVSQKRVTLGAGRTDLYTAGWKMRLWNNTANDYEADGVNEIESISGNDIIFKNNFTTTLTTAHRMKFADYNEVVATQKRYAFVGITGSDFSVSEKSYKIVP